MWVWKLTKELIILCGSKETEPNQEPKESRIEMKIVFCLGSGRGMIKTGHFHYVTAVLAFHSH